VVDPERLVQGWFEVRRPEPGIITIVEPLHEEEVKSYLITGSARSVLIDTGMGVGDIHSLVRGLTDLSLTVVNSHAHWDHIGGTHQFAGEAEILIHRAEAADLERGVDNDRLRRFLAPDRLRGPFPPAFDLSSAVIPDAHPTGLLQGGEAIDLGDRTLEILAAPGHSPGGVVLLDRQNGILFSTDAAYPGALYAQLDHSDLEVYRGTMRMLAGLAPSIRTVYPAHDESPMDPMLLPAMADALDAIALGRAPDDVSGRTARHLFAGFSVLTAAGTPAASGA